MTLDAQTVANSLERVVRSRSAAGLPAMVDVKSVEVVSPSQIRVQLHSPSTFLLEDLNLPITRSNGKEAIGTGPFFQESSSPTGVVMAANQSYYLGRPSIDHLDITSYPTLRTAWAGMMRGDVDFLWEVGRDALGFVQRSTNVHVYPVNRPYAYIVFLNERIPSLRSSLVRRALNAAIDREQLVSEGLQGHGVPEQSPVWPEHWAYDSHAAKFSHDIDLADRLLDEAGLDAMRVSGPPGSAPAARLHIRCLVPNGFAEPERLALLLQQQLQQVGIDFELQSVSANEFATRVTKGDFEAALIDFIGGPELAPVYWSWHSHGPHDPQGFNYGDYRDTQVDRSLEALRHARNDREYRAAVSRFQDAIVSDPPAIFLAWGETFRVVARRFVVPAPDQSHDIFPSLFSWKLASAPEASQ